MLYPDKETNKVYFSNLLERRFSKFSKELFEILDKYNVQYELIPNTKDIWMRDYMPIQNTNSTYIRYIHQPDYLEHYKSQRTNPIDATSFIKEQNIIDISLNLDGGNIVREKYKVICTDKIFKANNHYSKKKVIEILKIYFGIKEVIIIPQQPNEMTGHSDGLVRFVNENKVIMSAFTEEDQSYKEKLLSSLVKHNLEVVTFPNIGYFLDTKNLYGEWIPYINYLQIGSLVVVPIGKKIKNKVKTFFNNIFKNCHIEYIDATDILEQGGALNCISWNIHNEA